MCCLFILVITIYPSLLIIHHKWIAKYERPCLCGICIAAGCLAKEHGTNVHSNSKTKNEKLASASAVELQVPTKSNVATSADAVPNTPTPELNDVPTDLIVPSRNDEGDSKSNTSDNNITTNNNNNNNESNSNNSNDDINDNNVEWSLEQDIDEYRAIERFLGVTWAKFVIKSRLIVLVCFLILFGLTIYFATQIEPQDEDEAWFKDTHYMQLATDMANEFTAGAEDRLVTVNIIWGVNGVNRKGTDWYDPTDYGVIEWDDNFDFSSPQSQIYLNESCKNLSESSISYPSSVICPMDDIIYYIENILNDSFPWTYIPTNNTNYNDETQSNEFAIMLYNFTQTDYSTSLLSQDLLFVESPKSYSNGNNARVRFIGIRASGTLTWDSTVTEAFDTRDAWEDWLDLRFRDNSKCPNGLTNPFQANLRWAWLQSTIEFVRSALQGIAVAMPLAFCILLLSTNNWIMALFATFDIIGVIMCELAVMSILGWQFGVAESVAVVVMIGFSVDYVVHLANAYLECPSPHRHDRVQFALLTMGISIVSGAITTIMTGSFLTIPAIIFFEKMGVLILTTIFLVSHGQCVFSLLYCHNLDHNMIKEI